MTPNNSGSSAETRARQDISSMHSTLNHARDDRGYCVATCLLYTKANEPWQLRRPLLQLTITVQLLYFLLYVPSPWLVAGASGTPYFVSYCACHVCDGAARGLIIERPCALVLPHIDHKPHTPRARQNFTRKQTAKTAIRTPTRLVCRL